jgi:UDP-N-acetylmuramoylalanine-D-glutamate ligase
MGWAPACARDRRHRHQGQEHHQRADRASARALGVRTALAGNIGMPLLELLDQSADLWVIELSSFQTGEAGPLELGVITSLYEEHLDWHGSRERYVADKLKLAQSRNSCWSMRCSRCCWSTPGSSASSAVRQAGRLARRRWISSDAARDVFPIEQLAAPGLHNALNACAALAALAAVGMDALAAAPALATFRPLPHRLQPLGEHAGWHWINDSISTTPQATLAALESLHGRAGERAGWRSRPRAGLVRFRRGRMRKIRRGRSSAAVPTDHASRPHCRKPSAHRDRAGR